MNLYRGKLQPLAYVLLLALAGSLYWPGLGGGFHLDDAANLRFLDQISATAGFGDFFSLAFSGISGATRWLPQLSFVLQARAWPEHPDAFIAFNIGLHLCNGLAVSLLASKLARIARLERHAWIGLATGAVWLLSPIQVAGVLYIVQRINQFAALFVFLGTLAYVHGRERYVADQSGGLAWMMVGVFGCGGLAVFSKENGALLPLLLLTLEATVLPGLGCDRMLRRLRLALLGLPLLALVFLLMWRHAEIMAGYAVRDFNWAERLLTQPQVLLGYLGQILLPRGTGLGLMHDGLTAAAWPPTWTTAFALVAMCASLALSLLWRRRFPLAAFGMLWFLAGHALEASWIPLELSFDHRNYVPLFGPAFAIAGLALKRAGQPFPLLLFLWTILLTGITYGQAKLWGQPDLLLAVWAKDHPDSPRALSAWATRLALGGHQVLATEQLEKLLDLGKKPAEVQLLWLKLGCGGVALPDGVRVMESLAQTRYSTGVVNGLADVADLMEERACPALAPADMLKLIDVLRRNPAYHPAAGAMQVLAGRYLEMMARYDEALREIRGAYRETGNPELGFILLRLLNALGRVDEARSELEALERRIGEGGLRTARYRNGLEIWRRQLDIQQQLER